MRSTPAESRGDVFDAVVIGTGFGGAVTACRLVQAGFRICVLERGRRYGPFDFPKFPAAELFEDGSNTEQFAPAMERCLASGKPAVIDVKMDPQAITPNTTIDKLRAAALAAQK